jgi:hypothetical protein
MRNSASHSLPRVVKHDLPGIWVVCVFTLYNYPKAAQLKDNIWAVGALHKNGFCIRSDAQFGYEKSQLRIDDLFPVALGHHD